MLLDRMGRLLKHMCSIYTLLPVSKRSFASERCTYNTIYHHCITLCVFTTFHTVHVKQCNVIACNKEKEDLSKTNTIAGIVCCVFLSSHKAVCTTYSPRIHTTFSDAQCINPSQPCISIVSDDDYLLILFR